jgi:hypothetical protein
MFCPRDVEKLLHDFEEDPRLQDVGGDDYSWVHIMDEFQACMERNHSQIMDELPWFEIDW